MTEIISQLDIISLILGAFLGFAIGFTSEVYLRRSKLNITGSGGGSRGDGIQGNNITISNKTGWFGVTIHETVILGFKIHPTIRLGLPFERVDAKNCRASLFLADTNECVSTLWWRNTDGSVSDTKSIVSGESASLLIFITKNHDRRYFPYAPNNKETGDVKFPDEPAYFYGTNNFYIKIYYSYNQILKFPITISEKFNGMLYLETNNGSSFFSQ